MTVRRLASAGSQMFRHAWRGSAYLLMFLAVTSVARAGFGRPVPEIDPASAVSALTLFVGSVMLLTDRIRGK